MTVDEVYLDTILEEAGEFGKYQLRIAALIMVIIGMSSFPAFAWIFETKQVNHRCAILECESTPVQYMSSWYTNAVPLVENKLLTCKKYMHLSNSTFKCEFDDFNRSVIEQCNKFVYETAEITIIHDFDLQCDHNLWKLTLVGTINSVGMFIGLPIAGVLSDKYGRKITFLSCVSLSALFGIIRSFSSSYSFFIVMEFIDSVCRAGTYAIGYILNAELAGPRKRVLVAILNSTCYALGASFVGALAWVLQEWRILDRVLYGSSFISLTYYWLIPESVRWLLTKKRYKDAEKILKNLAKTNGKKISEENLQKLFTSTSNKITSNTYPINELIQSSTLTKRLINCCICWIICIFCYYGLTINAVTISENGYIDFIAATLVEIPGSLAAYFIVIRIGRRYCLSGGFFICSVACLSFIFISSNLRWLKLAIYLLGKFAATVNITVIYTLTTEIFPTSLRSSLLTICSMFGRIGSIIAPQLRLMELYWAPSTLTLFSGTALIASGLCLLFPETKNTTLLDTVKEAENIGKKHKEIQKLLS